MTIRMGVIGAGAISDVHLKALAAHDHVEVTCIADPSAEARERQATKYGVGRSVADYREMLERLGPRRRGHRRSALPPLPDDPRCAVGGAARHLREAHGPQPRRGGSDDRGGGALEGPAPHQAVSALRGAPHDGEGDHRIRRDRRRLPGDRALHRATVMDRERSRQLAGDLGQGGGRDPDRRRGPPGGPDAVHAGPRGGGIGDREAARGRPSAQGGRHGEPDHRVRTRVPSGPSSAPTATPRSPS